jgi:hypothetical protein
MWATSATISLDLDTTGAEPGDALLDSTARSLDSYAYLGGRPFMGAINQSGFLSSLSGPNLPATMETAEVHLAPGMRAFCSEAYPLGDSVNGTITVSTRERLQDAPLWGTPVPLEITGSASILTSSRLHRFRHNTGIGDIWTNAQGMLVEAQSDGAA